MFLLLHWFVGSVIIYGCIFSAALLMSVYSEKRESVYVTVRENKERHHTFSVFPCP